MSVKRRNEREGSERGVLHDNVDMIDFGSVCVCVCEGNLVCLSYLDVDIAKTLGSL